MSLALTALAVGLLLAAPDPVVTPPDQVLRAALGDGPIDTYAGEAIYEYMDGAGELPTSCGFRTLAVRHLKDDQGRALTVELFACDNSADAFGIYSLRRQPGETIVAASHRARWVEGELAGWRGPYAWVIASLAKPTPSRDDLLATARRIEAQIAEPGALPDLLRMLPTAGLKPDSGRYFHGKFALDTVWFRQENLLGLPLSDTPRPWPQDVAAAHYTQPDGDLIVARYPSLDEATKARERWLAAQQEGEASVVVGKCLGLAVGCANEADAAALLERLATTLAKPGAAWTEG